MRKPLFHPLIEDFFFTPFLELLEGFRSENGNIQSSTYICAYMGNLNCAGQLNSAASHPHTTALARLTICTINTPVYDSKKMLSERYFALFIQVK